MKAMPSASKSCVRCGRVLPLDDFYPHKSWKAQKFRDAWCKDCATQYCKDEDTVKQYCYENNRLWKPAAWETAMKKAQYAMAANNEYNDWRNGDKKRRELENQAAVKKFFSVMNLKSFYGYVDNIGDDGVNPSDELAAGAGLDKRTYNRKWGGFFNTEEIEYLEDVYSQYEEDFVLDNVNVRDYARKVAKASLNADIAEDKMRRGQVSAGEYKEAQRIFDDLSKSANFAACRRKPGDATGMGSLGEIIMRLEVSGALKENGFTFPEDDVDKIINDFRQTLRSVGIDGRL